MAHGLLLRAMYAGPRSTRRAPGEIRTPNLLIRSQMLYPLSYGRMTPQGQGDTLPASSQGQKLHRTRGENGGGGGI